MTEIIKSSGDVFKDLGVARPSTMAPHTPGAWSLTQVHTPSDEYGHWYHQIEAGAGYSKDGFCLSGIIRPEDARLIAAAPDLFEALDMARRYMKTCLGSSFWDGPNPHPIIDAALAKARGEVNA